MNRIRFLSRRPAALLLAASLAILAVQPAAADESAVVTGTANIVPGTLTADQWSLSENCRATPASTAYTFSWVVAVTDATGSGAGWTLTLTPMYFGTRRPPAGTYIGSVQALDDSSWEGSSPADEIVYPIALYANVSTTVVRADLATGLGNGQLVLAGTLDSSVCGTAGAPTFDYSVVAGP